jgi:diguanylate cyclase (GGDEF)-like protein
LLRYFPARKELGLVGIALILGVVENLIAFNVGRAPSLPTLVALSCLSIMSYSIGMAALVVHKGLPVRLPRTALPALSIAIAGVALTSFGWDYAWRFLPLQVAIALPMLEIVWVLWRLPRRNSRDTAMAVVLTTGASAYLLRIPAALLLLDPGFTRTDLLASTVFTPSMIVIIVTMTATVLLFLSSVADKIMAEYRERSERDPLTGIYNRRAFEERFKAEIARGGILAMADLDHFKQVNDRYGHATGDRAICAFSGMLESVELICGRLGGEEFAYFMPGAALVQGRLVAEGLRQAFSMAHLDADRRPIRLTASFGVTQCGPGEPLHACLSRADAALYRAKQAGRNRVCVAESEPATERRTLRSRALAVA